MSEDAFVNFEEFSTDRTAIFILTSPVRTAQYGFANLLFSIGSFSHPLVFRIWGLVWQRGVILLIPLFSFCVYQSTGI